MQWIKGHLMIVIVGSVSVLSLAGLVLGYVLSTVGTDLETDSRVLTSLRGIKPVNAEIVDATRQQQRKVSDKLSEFLQKKKDVKQYTPLEERVFSETDHVERTEAAYRFQRKYSEQQQELLRRLRAQDVPSEQEMTQHVEAARKKKETEQRELAVGLGGKGAVGPTDAGVTAPRGAGGLPGTVGMGGAAVAEEENKRLRMGLALSRAKSIYCYGSLASLDDRSREIEESLQGNKSQDEVTERIWCAQVGLWLEQDILGALAQLNDQTAADLPREAQWVAYMPVKRLIKFVMGSYVPPASGGGGGGLGEPGMRPAAQSGSLGGGDLLTAGPGAVFTQRGSTPSIDVVRFRLDLIVDARSLLKVLDAIAKAGFYTIVNVDFQEVVAQPNDNDYYIYGTAPILQVALTGEACFSRGSYEKWIPKSVASAITEGRSVGMGGGAVSPGVSPGGIRRPTGAGMPRMDQEGSEGFDISPRGGRTRR